MGWAEDDVSHGIPSPSVMNQATIKKGTRFLSHFLPIQILIALSLRNLRHNFLEDQRRAVLW